MSRQAIAAALAREDLAGGERLVAFSLASFAGHDGRAWPGAPAAAARAGLSRSRYLHDRDQLARRGLIVIEEVASGRGRASTVALRFAAEGPWWEGEINAELFEAVLSRTRTRGPARQLLAAMGALADADGVVRGVSSDELCTAAGVADRTYRRARRELLESSELALLNGAVGRGNTNVWQVRVAAEALAAPLPARSRRCGAPAGTRPLLAPVACPAGAVEVDETERQVVPGELGSGAQPAGSVLTGSVFRPRRAVRTGQFPSRTVLSGPGIRAEKAVRTGRFSSFVRPKTRRKTREKTRPPTRAREGNPRTPESKTPQPPLKGGSRPDSMMVEETFVSERGRRRRRMVPVDLAEVRRGLGLPSAQDRSDWQRTRELVEGTVGESMFAIWLAPVRLIAVDGECRLVVATPEATAAWTRERFGRVLAMCADQVGRELRFASQPEIRALGGSEHRVDQPRQEVAG